MKSKTNILVALFMVINYYAICQDSLLLQNLKIDTTTLTPKGGHDPNLIVVEKKKVENGKYRDNIWHRTAYITYYGDSISIIDKSGTYNFGMYHLKRDGKYWKENSDTVHIIVTESGLLKAYYMEFTDDEFKLKYYWKRVSIDN